MSGGFTSEAKDAPMAPSTRTQLWNSCSQAGCKPSPRARTKDLRRQGTELLAVIAPAGAEGLITKARGGRSQGTFSPNPRASEQYSESCRGVTVPRSHFRSMV